MPGKKGSKKRPSRQFNNGVGDRVVQTGRYGRTAKRTQLGRTKLNDYAGQETAFVEAKNQNDYEGLNENDFIRNTNNNDYETFICCAAITCFSFCCLWIPSQRPAE